MSAFTDGTTDAGVRYATAGGAGPLLVFTHGYRDSNAGWKWVAGPLVDAGLRVLLVQRNWAPEATDSPAALEAYAAQVVDAIASAEGPDAEVILVGQSMGGAVAELAARSLGDAVRALILVNPAPLGGFPLPPEVLEQFVAGTAITDPAVGAETKLALTAYRSDELLDRLVESTPEESAESSLQSLMSWVDGHPSGAAPSDVTAPVAVVVTDDQFFSEQVLREFAVPRFADVRVLEVRQAGHFAHIEQPQELASRIRDFVGAL